MQFFNSTAAVAPDERRSLQLMLERYNSSYNHDAFTLRLSPVLEYSTSSIFMSRLHWTIESKDQQYRFTGSVSTDDDQ